MVQNHWEKTIRAFDLVNVCGASLDFEEAYELKEIKINDINFGFLSFCESEFGAITKSEEKKGGFAWINHSCINKLVMASRQKVDFLIVQVHAGIEEVELPLPEWRDRYKELIDYGVDIIIGHHPHVPQGWEEYNNSLIFYSLGNFYFDMDSTHKLWNKGYIVSISCNKKQIKDFTLIPISKRNQTVGIDKNKNVKEYLNYLCKILQSEEYIDRVNKQALYLWDTRYKNYYFQAIGRKKEYGWKNILEILKHKIMKTDLPKDLSSNLLLLHNIRIESHRWIVERALSLLEE